MTSLIALDRIYPFLETGCNVLRVILRHEISHHLANSQDVVSKLVVSNVGYLLQGLKSILLDLLVGNGKGAENTFHDEVSKNLVLEVLTCGGHGALQDLDGDLCQF